MPDVTAKPNSLRCKICGGEIINDYLSGSCVCAYCKNTWSMQDLLPEYKNYASAIEKMKKARALLDDKPDVTNCAQAKLLFQSASTECLHTDAIASELHAACKDGMKESEDLKHYATAESHFEKKRYRMALSEYEKIPNVRNSAARIEECKKLQVTERKKNIPFAVIIGLVIPAVLGLLLKEIVGFPILAIIPICLVLVAGIAYAVYREGPLSIVLIVISFLCFVPLVLFMVLAYGFHMDTKSAAITSIVAPIALIVSVGLGVRSERKG